MERWLQVPGYAGRYEVSDAGRVASYATGKRKIMDLGTFEGRYRRVGFTHPGQKNPTGELIHQLVLRVFVGPRPKGLVVRHLNGDAFDNRLTNLAYGTPAQNTRDSIDHGTHRSSSRTHCPRGHAYDAANTYVRPNGARKCRRCNTLRQLGKLPPRN